MSFASWLRPIELVPWSNKEALLGESSLWDVLSCLFNKHWSADTLLFSHFSLWNNEVILNVLNWSAMFGRHMGIYEGTPKMYQLYMITSFWCPISSSRSLWKCSGDGPLLSSVESMELLLMAREWWDGNISTWNIGRSNRNIEIIHLTCEICMIVWVL